MASADAAFRDRVMRSPVYADAQSEVAVGGAHALAKLLQWPCDGVLLDRNLPDLDATEVAEQIRKQYPQMEVELIDPGTAGAPGGAGADVARSNDIAGGEPEPGEIAAAETATAEFEAEDSDSTAIASTCEENDERRTIECAEEEAAETPEIAPLPGMIGSSRAMEQVYRLVQMVANRDTTVLVTGETGTGKELVAEAVHALSRRAKHPFVVVNCAAIPESLLEAELFGHARGAFTGAVQSRLGRIHVAQGGTLFLDEVGELPLSMQAKLLRFLQSGEVQRLGSSDVYRVDVRVVCATNVKLQELTRARQFRPDLYYRLAIFPVMIPPLRERAGDVRALAEFFLGKFSAESGVPAKHLSAGALRYLEKASWPGNVRELQHAIERAFILAGNDLELGVEHFQTFAEYSE